MRGKREAKRTGQLSRMLVVYCISVLTITAIWGAVLKSIAPSVDLTDVLTFIGAAFGGELLLLAFKRVFAKERTETEDEEYERDFEEVDQP